MTMVMPQASAKTPQDSLRQDSVKSAIIEQYRDSIRKDSIQRATASPAQVDTNKSAMPMPEMRTPQNSGYLLAAMLVAGSIYTLYLFILFRRWSALRLRQQKGAARDGRAASSR